MRKFANCILPVSLFCILTSVFSSSSAASNIAEAISKGDAYGDFRLRYESVDQDSFLDNADALTLRSRLGYQTGVIDNFSATVEVEDSRIVAGVDNFSVGPTGFNPGRYSVIADPETTEIDQAYIQYSAESFSSRLGRQVLTFDNHRFIGHVGWRQDRQTFDAFSIQTQLNKDLTANYAYLGQRNLIFAEDADINSKDHLLNIAYKTPVGKLVGYVYLLETDNDINNALDTYGLRLTGSTKIDDTEIFYSTEFATQRSENGGAEFDADYLMLEGGVIVYGVSVTVGIEVLGSDEGNYGFSTPLATMFKFNGWSDQFLFTPANGLKDVSFTLDGNFAGGKYSVAYHDFEADEKNRVIDDFGSEVNISYSKKFGKNYYAGIKYATYSAGDTKVDTDKLWVWVGFTF